MTSTSRAIAETAPTKTKRWPIAALRLASVSVLVLGALGVLAGNHELRTSVHDVSSKKDGRPLHQAQPAPGAEIWSW